MLDTLAQEAKQPAPLAPPTPTLPEAVDLLERNMIGQTLLPFFAYEELVTNDWRISMLVARPLAPLRNINGLPTKQPPL